VQSRVRQPTKSKQPFHPTPAKRPILTRLQTPDHDHHNLPRNFPYLRAIKVDTFNKAKCSLGVGLYSRGINSYLECGVGERTCALLDTETERGRREGKHTSYTNSCPSSLPGCRRRAIRLRASPRLLCRGAR
jgi:hypothetical protein